MGIRHLRQVSVRLILLILFLNGLIELQQSAQITISKVWAFALPEKGIPMCLVGGHIN